jgi:hypothetical protein
MGSLRLTEPRQFPQVFPPFNRRSFRQLHQASVGPVMLLDSADHTESVPNGYEICLFDQRRQAPLENAPSRLSKDQFAGIFDKRGKWSCCGESPPSRKSRPHSGVALGKSDRAGSGSKRAPMRSLGREQVRKCI